jgi:hypothetical protein
MTFEQLFERKKTRTLFFAGSIVVVLLMLCVRYFVLPEFEPGLSQGLLNVAAKLLEDLSSTVIVTVLVAFALWYVTPQRVRQSGVTVVEPRELKSYFNRALINTREWKFCGGCGRYFRSAVLSMISNEATSSSTSKRVSAIVLNPLNDALCERHAFYRSGTRKGKADGNWTTLRVKQELLATIIMAKQCSAAATLVDVQILVSDHFSGFRMDISDSYAIETREDSTAPALLCEFGTYYFGALVDEFRLIERQATRIKGGEDQCHSISDVTSLRLALGYLRIGKNTLADLNLQDSELQGVLSLIQKNENPYA